jgi:hypothetical protein
MPQEVTVTSDPLVVYAVVALLLGSVVIALLFSLPRRGLGAVRRSEMRTRPDGDLPWIPGTDILGGPQQSQPTSPQAAVAPPRTVEPGAPSPAPAALPTQAGPSSVPEPWSTGSPDPSPRWDKR